MVSFRVQPAGAGFSYEEIRQQVNNLPAFERDIQREEAIRRQSNMVNLRMDGTRMRGGAAPMNDTVPAPTPTEVPWVPILVAGGAFVIVGAIIGWFAGSK